MPQERRLQVVLADDDLDRLLNGLELLESRLDSSAWSADEAGEELRALRSLGDRVLNGVGENAARPGSAC